MPAELEAEITGYEYTGDISALGSLSLTILARSFEQLEVGQLDDLFPSRTINERTVVIQQQIEGLGIMPIVKYGVPAGSWVEPNRTREFRVTSAIVREDLFIDQAMVNQLRKVGTQNEQYGPQEIIADYIQKMVNRHRRTMDLFRTQVVLGGISYTDPRTNQTIDVDTQIPQHNLWAFNNFSTSMSAGDDLTSYYTAGNQDVTGDSTGAADVKAAVDLQPSVMNRNEAFYFMDHEGRYAGVPWTDRRCDILRCLRLMQQYFFQTNKVKADTLLIESNLHTAIQDNEVIQQFMGNTGILIADDQKAVTGTGINSSQVTMGPDGMIQTLGGLRVKLMDGLFRNPETSQIEKYFPSHKVVMLASKHHMDPNARLGMTQHPVGESPDGKPGLWMRSGPDQTPPQAPGRSAQLGDSFLPFAIYPHWISIINVCPTNAVSDSLMIDANLSYGTF